MVRITDLDKESRTNEEHVPPQSRNAGSPVVTTLQIVSSTNLSISPVPLSSDSTLASSSRQQLQTPLPQRETTPLSHIHSLDSTGRSNVDHAAPSSTFSPGLFPEDLSSPLFLSPRQRSLQENAPALASKKRKFQTNQDLSLPQIPVNKDDPLPLGFKNSLLSPPNAVSPMIDYEILLLKYGPSPLGLKNSLLDPENTVLPPPEIRGPPPPGLRNSLLDPPLTVPSRLSRSGPRNLVLDSTMGQNVDMSEHSLLDPPRTVPSRLGRSGPLRNSVLDSAMGQNLDMSEHSLLNSPRTVPSRLGRSGPLRNSVLDSTMGQNVDMSEHNIHSSASAAATLPPRPSKTPLTDPPFEWASNVRCKVNRLATLTTDKIWLQVKCMECRKTYKVWLDLHKGLKSIVEFRQASRSYEVQNPSFTEMPRHCSECHNISILEPVHAKKKRDLNWIGLLLTHELGSLSYDQLVYYCRHRGLPWHKCIKPQLVRMYIVDLINQLGLSSIPPPP